MSRISRFAQVVRRCDGCDKLFTPPMRDVLRGNGRFCSRRCSNPNRAHPKWGSRETLECATCNRPFERLVSHLTKRTPYKFCSRSCKDRANEIGGISAIQPRHFKNGIYYYRTKALKRHGSRCQSCGYDQYEAMLDVHHRDGNRANNRIANLEVVCVWCHACETRGVALHNWWTTRDLNSAVILGANETTTPSSPVAQLGVPAEN